jgi:hypothetical protein
MDIHKNCLAYSLLIKPLQHDVLKEEPKHDLPAVQRIYVPWFSSRTQWDLCGQKVCELW